MTAQALAEDPPVAEPICPTGHWIERVRPGWWRCTRTGCGYEGATPAPTLAEKLATKTAHEAADALWGAGFHTASIWLRDNGFIPSARS